MSTVSDGEMAEVIREFLCESGENLTSFESTLLEAERDSSSQVFLASLFRSIHSIKGSCGFLGFSKLEALTHAGETVLGRLRDHHLTFNVDIASALFCLIDDARRILTSIETTGIEGEIDFSRTLNLLEKVSSISLKRDDLVSTDTSSVDEINQHVPDMYPDRHGNDGKIRVDIGLLDRLMNLVGELVLTRNQVIQFNEVHASTSTATPVQRLNLVTTEIQETVIKTRMQPIGFVWGRLPRIVRDLGSVLGKNIDLQFYGRETELDKSIIDAIAEPTISLIRYAVEHHIERPETRIQMGKNSHGTLTLRAFHDGGMVIIEIIDDGAGTSISNLSDSVESGEVIDAVRSQIEQIRGKFDVKSQPGIGTHIKIQIPLTLTIIPALIVGCGGGCYAIPQSNLLEVVRTNHQGSHGGIEWIHDALVFRLRDKLLPIVYLRREFKIKNIPNEAVSSTIVVLQADELSFGLVVDEIIDTEEIVVKALSEQLKKLNCYAGATVMGDGRVALILDPNGIAQLAGISSQFKQQTSLSQSPVDSHARKNEELLLVCEVGDRNRFALPLSKVTRLEKFEKNKIEYTNTKPVIQYRGHILPLMDASQFVDAQSSKSEVFSNEIEVVVLTVQDRQIGLIVHRINDILSVPVALENTVERQGVLGAMVLQNRVTEFLDVAHVFKIHTEYNHIH